METVNLYLICIIVFLAICLVLLFRYIKKTDKFYYEEEVLWTWDKKRNEVIIYDYENKPTRVPHIYTLTHAKKIFSNKPFKYLNHES